MGYEYYEMSDWERSFLGLDTAEASDEEIALAKEYMAGEKIFIYRLMGRREFEALQAGVPLHSSANWSRRGMRTESIGFCFFILYSEELPADGSSEGYEILSRLQEDIYQERAAGKYHSAFAAVVYEADPAALKFSCGEYGFKGRYLPEVSSKDYEGIKPVKYALVKNTPAALSSEYASHYGEGHWDKHCNEWHEWADKAWVNYDPGKMPRYAIQIGDRGPYEFTSSPREAVKISEKGAWSTNKTARVTNIVTRDYAFFNVRWGDPGWGWGLPELRKYSKYSK